MGFRGIYVWFWFWLNKQNTSYRPWSSMYTNSQFFVCYFFLVIYNLLFLKIVNFLLVILTNCQLFCLQFVQKVDYFRKYITDCRWQERLLIFRAIFNLSNEITLLILLRMFALKWKKAKNLSKKLKIDWRVIFLAQFRLAQDSTWLSSTQLDSAWFSLAQFGSV